MGALMLWGTLLLFIDSIFLVLIYERLRSWLGQHMLARIFVSVAAVLTFDQAGFFLGLHYLTGAPASVLIGGWAAKMAAAAFYAVLAALYLRYLETPILMGKAPRISDVFDVLTYRERYEDLLAKSGRDALTGALNRGRLEAQGPRVVDEAIKAARPVSVLLIDIDHFKEFNDRFGHKAGDAILRRIAQDITASVRSSDFVFRFGGEEFVVLCDNLPARAALALAERVRREIATEIATDVEVGPSHVTASIGLASSPADGATYDELFLVADSRLYQAKAAGRNCVVGTRVASVTRLKRVLLAGLPG
jgi:diguanylate cyclase (GGDEF)-like protein